MLPGRPLLGVSKFFYCTLLSLKNNNNNKNRALVSSILYSKENLLFANEWEQPFLESGIVLAGII